MIFHFILNPQKLKSKKQRRLEEAIKDSCKKRKLSYHIYYVTCPGEATEYVRSMVRISPDRQRFICVGGDATLSEIVNAAPSNPDIEFGIIPIKDNDNDFIRNFTDKSNFSSIDAHLNGKAVALDLIKCNETYCINMVNIGFDCAVARQAALFKKKRFINQWFAYKLSVFKLFFNKFAVPMRIIFDDGEIIDDKFTLASISNGRFSGGGYCAAPLSFMDDGLMDVCSITELTRFTFLRNLPSYKKGDHLTKRHVSPHLHHRQVEHARFEFSEPVPICIDGEIMGAKNIDFKIVKKAFNFIIPEGSDFKFKRKT